MTEYIDPDLKEFLENNNSADFEGLWSRNDPWFEEPNVGRSRSGWSGVCRIELEGRGFFLKKQENFLTYSIKKPLGVTVAEKEFGNLEFCRENKIPAMRVAYFGVRKIAEKVQAVIMTEELKGYYDLSTAMNYFQENNPDLTQKRKVIRQIALMLRDAHKKNFVHYSLYPKHIFVSEKFIEEANDDAKPLCRFIDLEKAVRIPWGKKKQLRDLETLNRRSDYWSKSDRLYFLLAYLMRKNVDKEVRKILKKIDSISKK